MKAKIKDKLAILAITGVLAVMLRFSIGRNAPLRSCRYLLSCFVTTLNAIPLSNANVSLQSNPEDVPVTQPAA